MDKQFFDLRATHNPHRWYLPLDEATCVGPPGQQFMFGGVGLAAAVAAMERTTGRPLVWATAQYLSYARPGSIVDFDVWTPVQGNYSTQARVIGHVHDREILTVNAALGSRPGDISLQWLTMPDVPRPGDCEDTDHWTKHADGVHRRLDVKIVRGRYGSGSKEPDPEGRSILWMRPRGGVPIDSAMLAIMADFVPSGMGSALGGEMTGNSLDNTLRIRRIVPTDWVLCDIRIRGMHGGFGHGDMHLYAQDGELMAMASQSLIVRRRRTALDD
jgi:acyl-CoA thioesterase